MYFLSCVEMKTIIIIIIIIIDLNCTKSSFNCDFPKKIDAMIQTFPSNIP